MFFEWQGNQPVTLRCIDKFHETHDCVSIQLADLTESFLFDFKPGQFINLGVEINGKMEFRAYSVSSMPGDDHLQLTIKRVEGGKVSNYILDSLLIGDTVQALAPIGEFNIVDHPPLERENQTKALFISAGCGITPVFAMAKHCLDKNIDIAFLNIARTPEETIYFDQLETLHSVYPNFELSLLLKDNQNTRHPKGRLNSEWLQQLVPDFKQRTIYLCGPNQFMLDTQNNLIALGFDMDNFHQESFTPTLEPTNAVSPDSNQDANVTCDNNETDSLGVSIAVPNFATTIDAAKGDLLADKLESAGLPLIIACRSGICGSCKCKVTKGAVTSSSQETLTEEEIAQGYVLACSSSLQSDVEVEIG
ncbi:hybrid-cluster NAD(P)-dependent oxidoreductase [Vibrio sinensis]|uniref:Hybrid-cluster NAD(P)-dependent oxidoreductase n=1 Tax=Vibrio sinensis TaxID=2302434 RepID=A0A3A6R1C6_9VIBR|nr:hybrid-cluster NAD(P)-dependent oxidoreductase [Vibrio sinensis]RJX70178.1 hybrid-cluster NAD(P)-dependent oxidoreductase [Vibrio sinensis]